MMRSFQHCLRSLAACAACGAVGARLGANASSAAGLAPAAAPPSASAARPGPAPSVAAPAAATSGLRPFAESSGRQAHRRPVPGLAEGRQGLARACRVRPEPAVLLLAQDQDRDRRELLLRRHARLRRRHRRVPPHPQPDPVPLAQHRVLARPGSPEAFAVQAAFSPSLIASTAVASQPHPERKTFLVEANALFVADLTGMASQLQRTYRQGYAYDGLQLGDHRAAQRARRDDLRGAEPLRRRQHHAADRGAADARRCRARRARFARRAQPVHHAALHARAAARAADPPAARGRGSATSGLGRRLRRRHRAQPAPALRQPLEASRRKTRRPRCRSRCGRSPSGSTAQCRSSTAPPSPTACFRVEQGVRGDRLQDALRVGVSPTTRRSTRWTTGARLSAG